MGELREGKRKSERNTVRESHIRMSRFEAFVVFGGRAGKLT